MDEKKESRCQCCLRSFTMLDTSKEVTRYLQELFFEVFHEELDYGMICPRCDHHFKLFDNFKREVLISRQSLHLETDIEVKRELQADPFECENPSLYLEQQPEIYICDSPNRFEDKKNNLRKILQSKLDKTDNKLCPKESEYKRILKQFKPKFVSDEEGKQTKSPKVQCPLCKKAITIRALPSHLRTHDSNRERNFLCELCSKSYINKHELVVHRRNHFNIRPFICDIEGKTFTSKNNLAKHIYSQHLNLRRAVDFKVHCPICNKLFPFQSKMNEHYRKAHPGGKVDNVKVDPSTNHYHCIKCGCEFLTKYRFDNHVCLVGTRSTSAGNRCPVCALTCNNRLQLIKHLQEHGERLDKNKWKCKVCKAIVQDKIAVHVENTHSTEFVHCTLCNKQLKNKKSLRQHVFLTHQNGYEIRKRKKLGKCSTE